MGQCLTKEQGAVVFATPDSYGSSTTLNTVETPKKAKADGPFLGDSGTKSQLLEQISTPSAIDTAQLTTIYRVPNEKYGTPDDVLIDRGVQLLEKFDEGGFANIFKARRYADPSLKMACKMVNIGNDLSDIAKLADIKNELFVLEKIKHPHIVRMYEHFIINEQLYIFMDYADFGNLYRFMYLRKGPMAEKQAKMPFSQIVSGVAFMHAKKIAHRDLKLSNILLKTLPAGSIVILIADFGLSRVVYRCKTGLIACKSYCGTPNYMAPELKQHLRYNAFDIDIYALGVMLFVMVQSCYPFDAQDDDKALEQAIKADIKWGTETTLTEQLRDLLRSLLEPNINKRISMCELIGHQWFATEMGAIAHTLPPVDQLPKKTALRRFSSPANDIRVRKTKPNSDHRPKSAEQIKTVKSSDQSKRTKSVDKRSTKSSTRIKSAPSKIKRTATRKKSAEVSSDTSKRRPNSTESRVKTNSSKPKSKRIPSLETISKTRSQKNKRKTSQFSSSFVKSGTKVKSKETMG